MFQSIRLYVAKIFFVPLYVECINIKNPPRIWGIIVYCLSFLSFAEDVGMSSRPVKGYDADFRILFIKQQPVGIDVAFPIAFVVARQPVVAVLRRKDLSF